MASIIDNFTTGEDQFLVPGGAGVTAESLRDGQMAGGKRHVLFSGLVDNRNQPAPFQVDSANRFNLTLPTGADITMNIIYGTQGAILRQDWSSLSAFNIDIGSYTSVDVTTYTVVASSQSGGRLEFNERFPKTPTSQGFVLRLPFADWKKIDAPDLARINVINVVMTLQGGIWIRELSVT